MVGLATEVYAIVALPFVVAGVVIRGLVSYLIAIAWPAEYVSLSVAALTDCCTKANATAMCHTYLLPGLHKVQGVISTVVVRCLPGSPRTKEEAALVDNGSALIETSAPSQCEALPPPPLPARARLEGEPEEDQCPPGSPTESKAELPDDTLSLSGLLRGIDKRLLTELEVGYSAVVVAIRSRLPDMSCQSPWTKASALAYGPFAWVAQGNYLATSCIDSVVGYGQRAYKLITDGIGGFRARTVNFLS